MLLLLLPTEVVVMILAVLVANFLAFWGESWQIKWCF